MQVGPDSAQLVLNEYQTLTFFDPSQPMRGVVLTNQSIFNVEVTLADGTDVLQPAESNYYPFPSLSRGQQTIKITPTAVIPSVAAPSNIVTSVIVEASDQPGTYPVFNTSLAALLASTGETLLATVPGGTSATADVNLTADMLGVIVVSHMAFYYDNLRCTVTGDTSGIYYPAAVIAGKSYDVFGIGIFAARVEPLVDTSVTVTFSGTPSKNWYVIGTTEDLMVAVAEGGPQFLNNTIQPTGSGEEPTGELVGGLDASGYGRILRTASDGTLEVNAIITPAGTQDVAVVSPVDGSGYVEVDVMAGIANPLPVSGTVTADQGTSPWVTSISGTPNVAITSPVDGSGYVEVDVKAGIANPLPTQDAATGQNAHAAPADSIQVAGQDASGDLSPFGVDQDNGQLFVEGAGPAGSAPAGSGYPVLVAGSDGTDVRTIRTDNAGYQLIVIRSAPDSYGGSAAEQTKRAALWRIATPPPGAPSWPPRGPGRLPHLWRSVRSCHLRQQRIRIGRIYGLSR